MKDDAFVPIKWRAGPPPGNESSLYQFVREHLWRHGGTCSRDALLTAIQQDPAARSKLEHSRGFSSLLSNMRHSGEIETDGDLVSATPRALRRGAQTSTRNSP